jgi:hypothetical protein
VISIRDLREIGKIAALALIAWSLLPRAWRKASLATAALGEAEFCWPPYRRFQSGNYTEAALADISLRRRAMPRK